MKRLLPVFLLVSFALFLVGPINVLAAPNEDELTAYLTELNWTKQDLENYLVDYDLTLDDFDSIADLKDFLGDPVNDNTLQNVLAEYDLTMDELTELLKANGKTLDDYKFVYDLEYDLDDFTGAYDDQGDLLGGSDSLTDFGLTDEEFEKLLDYVMAQDPENLDGMDAISDRFMAFSDSLGDSESLTKEQAEELASIYEDMMSLLKIKATYYLEKGTDKKQITLADLFQMDDLAGGHLIVEMRDLDGNLLADMDIDPALLDTELIKQTGEDVNTVTDSAPVTAVKKQAEKAAVKSAKAQAIKSPTKTVQNQGGALPNTATHQGEWLVFGILLAIIGSLLLRRTIVKFRS